MPNYNPYFSALSYKPLQYDMNVGFNARPDYISGIPGGFQNNPISGFGYDASRLNNVQTNQTSFADTADEGINPMAAGQAVLGLATDLSGIANQRLNLGEPVVGNYQQGIDPTYQTGDYFGRAFSSVPQKTTGMEVGGTALKTALSAGQLTGFNPIAMGIGAAIGGIGSAIAGNRRRVRQTRERNKALNKAISEQQRFNTAQENYNQEQMVARDYQRRSNPYTRMSNLYSI